MRFKLFYNINAMKNKLCKLSTLFLLMLITACSKEKRTTNAAEKMQNFVIAIAQKARQSNPDFIIVPQNGIELAYNEADTSLDVNSAYLSAIDGVGVEGVFYGNEDSPDPYRLAMLQTIKQTEKVLSADYLTDNSNIQSAMDKNVNEGFICFPRLSNNYDYTQIPNTIINENPNDITQLSEAQNYLYLISTDAFSSKDEMLSAIASTNFDLILIDLFYDGMALTQSEVNSLKTKANGGKRLVIAYFNIGSAEKYRYYWKKSWSLHFPNWLKKKYDGYPDEIWVKFWNKHWQEIIYKSENSYLDKILTADFDGVYLDNVEAYYFLYNE